MEKVQENYWNWTQRPKEAEPCPKCGKKMVAEMSGMVMTSNPPCQRWYWECECGYQELGGVHRHEHVKTNVMI